MKSGVTQGSILGQILFNIFFNDFFDFTLVDLTHNFADNSTLSSVLKTITSNLEFESETRLKIIT